MEKICLTFNEGHTFRLFTAHFLSVSRFSQVNGQRLFWLTISLACLIRAANFFRRPVTRRRKNCELSWNLTACKKFTISAFYFRYLKFEISEADLFFAFCSKVKLLGDVNSELDFFSHLGGCELEGKALRHGDGFRGWPPENNMAVRSWNWLLTLKLCTKD